MGSDLLARTGLALSAAVLISMITACRDADTMSAAPHANSTGGTGGAPATPAPVDNGMAARPARQIVKAAQGMFASSSSVHARGTTTEDGHVMKLDMWFGQGVSQGTILQVSKGAHTKLELRSVRHKLYMRGDRAFWKDAGGEGVAAAVANRWVIAPSSALGSDSAQLLGVREFAREFTKQFRAPRVVGRATIGGQRAIELRSGTDIAFVATTGPARLLRGTSAKNRAERLDFSDYGAPLHVTAPPDAIDFSKIKA